MFPEFGKPPPLDVLRRLPCLGDGHDPYAVEPGSDPEVWARSYPRIVTGSHELRVLDRTMVLIGEIALPRHTLVASIEPDVIPFHIVISGTGARIRIDQELPCSFTLDVRETVMQACVFLAVERDEAIGRWVT